MKKMYVEGVWTAKIGNDRSGVRLGVYPTAHSQEPQYVVQLAGDGYVGVKTINLLRRAEVKAAVLGGENTRVDTPRKPILLPDRIPFDRYPRLMRSRPTF